MKKFHMFSFALLFVSILWGCEEDSDPPASNDSTILDEKIEGILNRLNLPGAQVAIMKNERLVYQKSYGLAVKESSIPVSNKSLFRIASISKPITAIGIYKLVQDRRLNLDSKVFGEGAILGNTFGTKPYSQAIKSITVRHLLEHKAGGWANDGSDPMFIFLNYSQHQLIDYILDTRPLDHQPGSTFKYSNFGYCILGRIIEKVSGLSYETYIKKNILGPCGITTMHIANNLTSGPHENEVKYYNSTSEFSPYQIDANRMDAGGGWVGSATDLLRFMVRIDRLNQKEDLLNAPYLNEMYFGFFNWIHTGAMAGTLAVLERVNDEFSFAVLSNGSTSEFNIGIEAFRKAITEEINSRSSWPNDDLFDSP